MKKLNDIINAKITSMQDYNMDNLEFVELIIHDQGDLFGGESGRKIHQHLSELSQSPFEGFLIDEYILARNLVHLTSQLFFDRI